MKVLKAYTQGWSAVFRNKGMCLVMYLINFALALFAAIPVSGFLGEKVRYTMSLGRSKPGFDYTFLGEMQQRFGDEIDAILNQTNLFIILFLIASVFMMGGVLQVFKKEDSEFTLKSFWDGGSKYFWRILRLTIYFLVLQLAVLFFFFTIFSWMCDGLNPFAMQSEKQMIDALMILGPIYLVVFTLITLVQDYAKIHLVHTEPNILFKTFWGSFKLVFKNLGKFISLYLLNILTFGIAFGIYWTLGEYFQGINDNSITVLFIIGQLFIIARITIKLLNLASATNLYKWTRKNYFT